MQPRCLKQHLPEHDLSNKTADPLQEAAQLHMHTLSRPLAACQPWPLVCRVRSLPREDTSTAHLEAAQQHDAEQALCCQLEALLLQRRQRALMDLAKHHVQQASNVLVLCSNPAAMPVRR